MGPSHAEGAHRRGTPIFYWLHPSGPHPHSGMMTLGLTTQAFLNWLDSALQKYEILVENYLQHFLNLYGCFEPQFPQL